jgi:hypothetical protein
VCWAKAVVKNAQTTKLKIYRMVDLEQGKFMIMLSAARQV